jgi:hypothetical protein
MDTLRRVYNGTFSRFTEEWIQNAYLNGKNFPTMKSFLDVSPMLDPLTAVVCGSGPSLMKDIEIMKRWSEKTREHYVIFGNHSNGATLLYHGIVPDFIVVTDSSEETTLRFSRDILHWKKELKSHGTRVILTTTCHPELPIAARTANLPLFWFKSLMTERGNDPRAYETIYNQIITVLAQKLELYILQAGSVTNAIAFIVHTMAWNGVLPKILRVGFSGVDCGYPDGITRCDIVEYDEVTQKVNVTIKPTVQGQKLKVEIFAGLRTDAAQILYRGDLQYIVETISKQQQDEAAKEKDRDEIIARPVRFFTTSRNFIADFLDVVEL